MLPADLINLKTSGKQITVLTAWDSISARIVEAAGTDVVLIGDSLAMVALGHTTTLPVTLEQMLHHSQAVCRGLKKRKKNQPLVVCDLPFLSYQCGEDKAVFAAGKLLKNSCVSAVKIEGAETEVINVISRLIRMGIPVMGHLGLTPQSVHVMGYRKQAKEEKSKIKLITEAKKLEKVGCFAIVLEHIPDELAKLVSIELSIPVLGIGAGKDCDGQVRVTADLLGLTENPPPFSNPLIETGEISIRALKNWINEQHQEAISPTKEEF
tara:strand:- start:202 stop:1002 length:801 start_codon:yes stop_codon:yes gene_type:complete